MVVSLPLLLIAEDFVGADDLPELQGGVGIAGTEIGMGAFDGFAEGGPETLGIIVRKGAKQIVKRRRLSLRVSSPPSKFPPRIYSGARIQTEHQACG